VAGHVERGFTAPRLDYAARCRRLAAIFGAESLVVRRFLPDALAGGDARTDLLRLMGVEAPELVATAPPSNPSASVREAVLLRIVDATAPERFPRKALLACVRRRYAEGAGRAIGPSTGSCPRPP
jgi:hypothetical protein